MEGEGGPGGGEGECWKHGYELLFSRKVGVDLKDIPADAVTIDATDKLVMPGNLSLAPQACYTNYYHHWNSI